MVIHSFVFQRKSLLLLFILFIVFVLPTILVIRYKSPLNSSALVGKHYPCLLANDDPADGSQLFKYYVAGNLPKDYVVQAICPCTSDARGVIVGLVIVKKQYPISEQCFATYFHRNQERPIRFDFVGKADQQNHTQDCETVILAFRLCYPIAEVSDWFLSNDESAALPLRGALSVSGYRGVVYVEEHKTGVQIARVIVKVSETLIIEGVGTSKDSVLHSLSSFLAELVSPNIIKPEEFLLPIEKRLGLSTRIKTVKELQPDS